MRRRKKKVEEQAEPMGEPDLIAVFDNEIQVWQDAVDRAKGYLAKEQEHLDAALKKKQDYFRSLKK